MIKVKLVNHEFRYEVFQIVSLYYSKTGIEFAGAGDEADELASGFLLESGVAMTADKAKVYCRITGDIEKPVFFETEAKPEDRKHFKNAIKATVLEALAELTGVEMPWGILVGIRPTKIVHEAWKEGLDNEMAIKRLGDEYKVGKTKAELVLEVAGHEARFLENAPKDVGLYIGIPFCPSRCSYCSFTSNPIKGREDLAAEYVDALLLETDQMLRYMKDKGFSVDTLYFGGGTPTALPATELARIIDCLAGHLDLRAIREFTIEAGRADSIDAEKLRVIRDSGCSRISINPQTMNDETLRRVGRQHTAAEVVDKFNLARQLGFDNINMDMIIGLPGEGVAQVLHTAEILRSLSPENITVHTMAVKRASVLNEQEYRDNSMNAVAMYEEAERQIRDMGMYPYYMYRQKNMVSPLENVGWCKAGHECVYNIQMIAESASIIALGADAVTKAVFPKENRIERAANVKDIREYINRVDEMVQRKISLFDTMI